VELRQDGAVAAALTWIEANFREPIRVEEAARRVFLSPDRFTEVFQTEMGRTPREYIRHLRLEYARKLLLTTDLPISEVGQEAGFGEPGYFARAFRQSAGVTPREYRTRSRAEARPRTQAESARNDQK
jgi:transcriptional regulator GlxA family with amidase domain